LNTFFPFELRSSEPIRLDDGPAASCVRAWHDGQTLELTGSGTHFGYVHSGPAELESTSGIFALSAGMYFAVPGDLRFRGGSGLTVTRAGFHGFFQVGGPVESAGRLRYIDGCSDSLLIPPVLKGDPCLNLLHIPPGTRQRSHTHPSVRVGLTAAGSGVCTTDGGHFSLQPGHGFVIPAGLLHRFSTDSDSLLVIAYHPDSDFGPTHECHPMINRTIIPTREPAA
jgi:quercetin dioxygenase-like cupin family protein